MPERTNSPEPVRRIASDPRTDHPEDGIALCLSGGGYRAMLFHLGALWRLSDLGYLPKLDRVSSVSGGSIIAAVLGLHWSQLGFDGSGVASNFRTHVVEPIRAFARTTTDKSAIFGGLLVPAWISRNVASAYRKRLYGRSTLQDLPDRPRFVINATNIQSGVLWRFSKPYMRDYRVGEVKHPTTELAVAVAASSAFPPVLSPTILRLRPSDYSEPTDEDLHRPPFTTNVVLSDGGVYDNLGLETAWKRYKTILVSDAGGKMEDQGKPKSNWVSHAYRVLTIIDNQVRSLRKRTLIGSYISGRRNGTFWGIRSKIDNYGLSDTLPCPMSRTIELADVPTRLKRMDNRLQERLVNWGFAICDAAIRKHVDPSLSAPNDFPYPEAQV